MYTLRVPFDTSDIYNFQPMEEPMEFDLGRARVESSGTCFVLVVDGLPSEAAASALLQRLKVGFHFAALSMCMPLSSSYQLGTVAYAPPGAVMKTPQGDFSWGDGIYSDGAPVIFRTESKLRRLTGYPSTVEIGVSGAALLKALNDGLHLAAVDEIGPKLDLAIDLYVSHYREASESAKFLTLVTALESLCEPSHRPSVVQELLKEMRERLDSALTGLGSDAELADRQALEALRGEFAFRSKDSIKNQLRRLVRDALATDSNVEANVSMMGKLYDIRSRLLHEGEVQPEPGFDRYAETLKLVRRVLEARLRRGVVTG